MFNKQMYLLLFAVLLTINGLMAQKKKEKEKMSADSSGSRFKYTLGETFEMEGIRNVFRDSSGFIVFGKKSAGRKGNKPVFFGFDNALNKIFEKDCIVPLVKGEELTFTGVLLISNKPVFFYQCLSKTGGGQLYAAALAEDGTLSAPKQVTDFEDTAVLIDLTVTPAPDGSKFMVSGELKHENGKLPLVFKVFDNQFKEIWQGKSTFVTSESAPEPAMTVVRSVKHRRQLLLDNNGRVFVMVPVARGSSAGKVQRDNLFKVFQFAQEQAESKTYTIQLGKNIIHYISLVASKDKDELICFGTYAGTSKVTLLGGEAGAIGTFHGRLNVAKGEVSPITVEPFSDETFAFMSISDKDVEKGDGVKFLVGWQCYVTDSNNLVIILEQNFLDRHEVKTPGSPFPMVVQTPYSNTGFVVKYAASGALMYQNYIAKKGGGNFGLHASTLCNSENPIIIHNNMPANVGRKVRLRDLDPLAFGFALFAKPAQPYIYTYDKAGRAKGVNLFENHKESFVIEPALMHFQYAPQSVLMLAGSVKNNGDYKLVRIDY